jgi:hypothetical protein
MFVEDIHDTVIDEHGQASEKFLSYLLEEDQRTKDEHNGDVQQQDVYDEVDILDPENMDNSEIASYQWCYDNPEWYKDL